MNRRTAMAAAFGLLLAGLARFIFSAVIPAVRALSGDFAAAFPSPFIVRLRPDFPTTAVLGADAGLWNYGPVFHLVTLPLALVPRWSWVPAAWAAFNLAAFAITFFLTLQLAGGPLSRTALVILAALWLLFQPLVNCFAQGNIEMTEMAVVMAGLVWLSRRQDVRGGAALAVASGIKLLPIGFVGWLLLTRKMRALTAAMLTLAVVWLVTSVTLDWDRSLTRRASLPIIADNPVAGFHELSVTSAFMHRASVLDLSTPAARWFPVERRRDAARAGALASAAFGVIFAVVLAWAGRRRTGVPPEEVAILFLLMLLLPPWNHDYYYVFVLVPVTLILVRALHAKDRVTMAVVIVAYLLMSPPLPLGVIERLHAFPLPFTYMYNFFDVPLVGALLLLWAATRRLFMTAREARA